MESVLSIYLHLAPRDQTHVSWYLTNGKVKSLDKKKKKSHSFTFISTHGSYFVCLVFEAGFLFIELAVLELTL